jgi:hypothetical protein
MGDGSGKGGLTPFARENHFFPTRSKKILPMKTGFDSISGLKMEKRQGTRQIPRRRNTHALRRPLLGAFILPGETPGPN